MKKTFVVIGSMLLAALAFAEIKSGREVGAKGAPAYNPQHVGGPFKGSTTCPV